MASSTWIHTGRWGFRMVGSSTPSTPLSHSQPGFAVHAHPGRQRHLLGIVLVKLRGFLAQMHWLPSLYKHENTADSCVPRVEIKIDKGNPERISPAFRRGDSIQLHSMALLQSLSPWAWFPSGCPLIPLVSLPTQVLGKAGSALHASITGGRAPQRGSLH